MLARVIRLVFSEHWVVLHLVVGHIRIVDRLSDLDCTAAVHDFAGSIGRIDLNVDLADLDIHVPVSARLLLHRLMHDAQIL